MDKIKINSPYLRFNGFEDVLQQYDLNSISTHRKGNGIPKNEIDNNGVFPCIRYGELYTIYNEVIWLINSKTNIKNKVESSGNEILIPSSGEKKRDISRCSALTVENVAIGGDINLIKINQQFSNIFIALQIAHKKWKNIYMMSQGDSVVHVSWSQIKKIILFIPELIEQTKIANFFTLLDKQIQLMERKLELYELRKKYYLNNMLKYIFDNGEKISMKELFIEKNISPIDNLTGYTPISIKLHGKGFKESTLNVKLSKGGRRYYERLPGDIVIGLQNFHNGSIGILPDSFIKPIMSNAIISFDVKKVNKLLMVEYFLSEKFLFHLRNISEGTGQKEFSKKNILDLEYFIIDQKIEESFSKFLFLSIEGINSIKKQKDQLTKRKTYYLNNMFV